MQQVINWNFITTINDRSSLFWPALSKTSTAKQTKRLSVGNVSLNFIAAKHTHTHTLLCHDVVFEWKAYIPSEIQIVYMAMVYCWMLRSPCWYISDKSFLKVKYQRYFFCIERYRYIYNYLQKEPLGTFQTTIIQGSALGNLTLAQHCHLNAFGEHIPVKSNYYLRWL